MCTLPKSKFGLAFSLAALLTLFCKSSGHAVEKTLGSINHCMTVLWDSPLRAGRMGGVYALLCQSQTCTISNYAIQIAHAARQYKIILRVLLACRLKLR